MYLAKVSKVAFYLLEVIRLSYKVQLYQKAQLNGLKKRNSLVGKSATETH